MKKIIFIFLILIITGCSEVNNTKIETVKLELQDGNKYNIYLELSDRNIYLSSNLEEVYYHDDVKMTLKDYLTTSYQTIDDGIKSITDMMELDATLRDGGTMIYRSMEYDMTIVNCKTVLGNKDIYIGDYRMEFDNNTMCNRGE